MPISSLEGLSDAQKQELVASLSAIVVGSSGGDVTAEALNAVATASGCSLSEAWASVFAGAVAKVSIGLMVLAVSCLFQCYIQFLTAQLHMILNLLISTV